MNDLTPFRFFAVVLRPRPLAIVVLFLLVGFAAWIAWTDPKDFDQTVVLAMIFQMFAAATGYREFATRGHFDALLAGGAGRRSVAAAHWVWSTSQGAIAWLALALIACLVHPRQWPSPLGGAAVAAFLYVSSAAWAFALPLARYATGVAWILVLFVVAGAGEIHTLREAFLSAGDGWNSLIRGTAATLVCPVFLITDGPQADARLLTLVLLASATFGAAGAWFIATLDVPLKDVS